MKISRRDFLKGSAAGALSLAATGLFGAAAVADEAPAAEEKAIGWDEIFATSYSQSNRRQNPDAKAPETCFYQGHNQRSSFQSDFNVFSSILTSFVTDVFRQTPMKWTVGVIS